MGAYIYIGATILSFPFFFMLVFKDRTHAAGSRDKKLIKGALKVVDHLKNTDKVALSHLITSTVCAATAAR